MEGPNSLRTPQEVCEIAFNCSALSLLAPGISLSIIYLGMMFILELRKQFKKNNQQINKLFVYPLSTYLPDICCNVINKIELVCNRFKFGELFFCLTVKNALFQFFTPCFQQLLCTLLYTITEQAFRCDIFIRYS